ncbi:hypothetical protein ABZW02_20205 [Streptomyces sp. NPDC005180]|uniref:zinc finger domain-containing protein n=1 Tax=Streptomyces sp. NPDC005180 TaxID=3156868 RepID=UPI0033B6E303
MRSHAEQTAIRRAMARGQTRAAATQRFAEEVSCPRCSAPAGTGCHLPGAPRLSCEEPHRERVDAAAEERWKVAKPVRCPTCGAMPHQPCAGRTDPHPLRWARGKASGGTG